MSNNIRCYTYLQKVHFNIQKNLCRSTFIQTANRKEVTAKLSNFEVMDDAGIAKGTLYQKIAENLDVKTGVFDVRVVLYDNIDPEIKFSDPDVVDILVVARLGRIKLVFLMKFVNDFLAFLEPFSSAKEMVAERANDALEGATKSVIDAYVNSTRVRCDTLKKYI